jgi:hypothetical protein
LGDRPPKVALVALAGSVCTFGPVGGDTTGEPDSTPETVQFGAFPL